MIKRLTLQALGVVLALALVGCYYTKTDKRSGKSQSISAQEYHQLNK